MKTEYIDITLINRITHAQSRVALDGTTLNDYEEMWREYLDQPVSDDNDYPFPPCVVYRPKGIVMPTDLNFLADGFHREASLRSSVSTQDADRKLLLCEVRDGNMNDAILYGLSANAAHGLRRNRHDKRRAVILYYSLSEHHTLESNQNVARACGVSHTFVGMVRKQLLMTTDIGLEHEAEDLNLGGDILKEIAHQLHLATDSGVINTTRNGQPLEIKAVREVIKAKPFTVIGKQFLLNKAAGELLKGQWVRAMTESLTDPDLVEVKGRFEDSDAQWVSRELLSYIQYPAGTRLRDLCDGKEVTVEEFVLRGEDICYLSVDDDGFKHKGAAELYARVSIKKTDTTSAAPESIVSIINQTAIVPESPNPDTTTPNSYATPYWLEIAISGTPVLSEDDLAKLNEAITDEMMNRLERSWSDLPKSPTSADN
jgi:hypothetical protein